MGRSIAYMLALLSVFVLSASVEAITNGELYEILTENLVDDKEADDATGDDDVTIDFPGDENDEVNTETLIEQLGFKDLNVVDVVRDDGKLMGGCSCSKGRCSCCTSKTFSAKILWKKVKARLSTCVTIEYLRTNLGFRLTFVVNGRTLFRREISLKHPPALCYNVPGLGKFARVCLEIYDVDLSRKSLCTRVAGVIDLKVKKWRFRIKIACFRIPTADDDQLEVIDDDTVQMTSDGDQRPVTNVAELFQMLKNGEISIDDLTLE